MIDKKHQAEQQRRQEWLSFLQALNPDIEPQAVRLMDELRMAAHTLYQVGEHSVTETGLSYAQYRILMSLHFCEWGGNQEGLNPSEISQHQGTSRNTISALIRSLESEGYIERQLDSGDRRRFNIRLTDAGRQKVLDHTYHHMHTINNIFAVLDEEEQTTLSKLLHAINRRALAVKDQSLEEFIGGSHATSR